MNLLSLSWAFWIKWNIRPRTIRTTGWMSGAPATCPWAHASQSAVSGWFQQSGWTSAGRLLISRQCRRRWWCGPSFCTWWGGRGCCWACRRRSWVSGARLSWNPRTLFRTPSISSMIIDVFSFTKRSTNVYWNWVLDALLHSVSLLCCHLAYLWSADTYIISYLFYTNPPHFHSPNPAHYYLKSPNIQLGSLNWLSTQVNSIISIISKLCWTIVLL